jgi:hypothetical protein
MYTQAVGRLVLKYPRLLIIPLTVLGLLLGLGLWGVTALQKSRADSNRQAAYWDAENAAAALQLDIYKGALSLQQMAALIKKYQNVQKVFNATDEVSMQNSSWQTGTLSCDTSCVDFRMRHVMLPIGRSAVRRHGSTVCVCARTAARHALGGHSSRSIRLGSHPDG